MGRKRHDGKGKSKRRNAREDDAAWRLSHLIGGAHLLSVAAPTASRFLMQTTRQISKRVTLTLDSVTVKRQACKECNTLLKPTGPTPVRVRVSPRPYTRVIVSCGHCGARRNFPAQPTPTVAKSNDATGNECVDTQSSELCGNRTRQNNDTAAGTRNASGMLDKCGVQ